MWEREGFQKEMELLNINTVKKMLNPSYQFPPAISGNNIIGFRRKKFAFKYVTIKVNPIIEINGKIKNKKSPNITIEFSGDNPTKEKKCLPIYYNC